ncbi:MAG: DUF4435 domain-containing protein [Rhodospirillales bacterium]|nr:DUF4435 domain-containing protein [Rhodospirillales bacterium]
MDYYSDWKEYLNDSAGSKAAIFHEFRINYSNEDNIHHVFVEGHEDRQVYAPMLNNKSQIQDLNFYVCKGKKRVSQVREKIEEEGEKYKRYLFLCDRDFDDFSKTQISPSINTYITDYYSIESQFVNKKSLKIILKDLVGMNKNTKYYNDILLDFQKVYKKFCDFIMPFMAFSIYMKSNNMKPTFNNVKLKEIFKLEDNLEVLPLDDAPNKYIKMCNVEKFKIEGNDFDKILNLLQREDPLIWIRGKFLIYLFELFVSNKVNFIRKKLKKAQDKGKPLPLKIPRNLEPFHCIDTLSARIEPAKSFNQFLDTYIAHLQGFKTSMHTIA